MELKNKMPSEQEYIDAIADLNTLLAVRDQRIRELELQMIKANKLIKGANHANGKSVQVQKTEDKDKKVFGQKEEKKVE
jgi:hypothetical protein